MSKCHLMLCITANDQTNSNKFDFEHKKRFGLKLCHTKEESSEEFHSSVQAPFWTHLIKCGLFTPKTFMKSRIELINTNNDTGHHCGMKTDSSSTSLGKHRAMLDFEYVNLVCQCHKEMQNHRRDLFLTLESPPSCSPGSGVFCPLLVVNQTQKVLLSWWHLNGWSLEWTAELGMGQSGPVCHWQSWRYQTPVSVGLYQKRSVHYCHCLLLECFRKETRMCSWLKIEKPWIASKV